MQKTTSTPRIDVTAGGITFKNPFFVASGPTTKSVRQLVRIEETGWAAASIKLSIDPAPYINRKPRYGLFDDRQALAFTAEKRLTFEEGLQLVRDAKRQLHDLILMANITYAGDKGTEGWINMARRFEEVGADIIELNMCCPNMSYNVETTSGQCAAGCIQTGASMGQKGDVASEIVAAIKSKISIPLFVKLTPEGGHIAQVAKMLYEAGADAVGGTGNRLGIPTIDLEHPDKAFHVLQKEISMSCYSGAWLKPLAQRDTYEIRNAVGDEKKITAAGGITNWKDAVEMVLCGADLLGVCAETLISGYDIVRPMIRGLVDYMEQQGYASLDDMRSTIVPQVRTAPELTLYNGYARIKEPNLSAPCKSACPHHVPVQAYVQKVAQGKFREAYDLITGTHAMQEICALACERPCEDACIRGSVDQPVRIRDIKRFVLDYGEKQGWQPQWAEEPARDEKIAVVGAGAAGLSFAGEMARHGYRITVFDRNDAPGGSLRYLTPDFRLDKKVLEKTIDDLKACSVSFEMNRVFGVDFTLESLKEAGFSYVFLAVGPGDIKPDDGVISSADYLFEVNSHRAPEVSDVLIFGDDQNAVDAARAAVRHRADRVMLFLEGKRSQKSDLSEQLQMAEEEGVRIIERATFVRMEGSTAHVTLSGIPTAIDAPLVMISGKGELPESLLRLTGENKGRVRVDSKTGETTIPHVYAGGDAVSFGGMIGAIASAKKAAAAIDQAIRGQAATAQGIPDVVTVRRESVLSRQGYIRKDRKKIDLTSMRPEARASSDALATRVMTEEEAVREAARCLNCGCGEGCQLCKTICAEFAPEIAAPDTLTIKKEDCVACGMCVQRCPNHNIEMVKLGLTDCSLKVKEGDSNGCQF